VERKQEAVPSLVTTVLAALRSGRPARAFLDAQREQHLTTMRELTRTRHTASAEDRLVLDYQIFRIEADLRWIDHTAARLGAPEPEISL
jgi:hypothetical protein